jgi:hypothetical protein
MPELDTSAGAVTTNSPPGTGSITDEKLLAAQLFNQTWRLLEQEGRIGGPAQPAVRYILNGHPGQAEGGDAAHRLSSCWR